VAAGVTLFDTADVYGDGRSERIIGAFLQDNPNVPVTVATKMGRRQPQDPANYTLANFRTWIDRSRRNLGVDRLDLVQLHCPPSSVYSTEATYDALDTLVAEGVIADYGVSVERVEEALEAIGRGVASVQIILNAFRHRPLERVLPAASDAGVAILARVPLASGLLSGRYTRATTFAENDHRTYNRDGSAFDVGETFAGVPFEVGVQAAHEFASLVTSTLGPDITPAQAALAWVWQQPGVTSVIPGARNVQQARANAAAGSAPVLGPLFTAGLREIYAGYVKQYVHSRW
jgi:aryl-alcohol dehydrogenase-like predicted oxidoreductase